MTTNSAASAAGADADANAGAHAESDAGADICERLAWDSTFFGVPIARIRANRLTASLAARIDAWAAAEEIRCLYLLADPTDIATMRLADASGYRLVDVRVVHELRLDAAPRVPDLSLPPPLSLPRMADVRLAVADDIPALRDIASRIHRGTRFYNDPGFPDARCDELYATWIERSVEGWAERVFVTGPIGAAHGYISCHRDGRIGLTGVRADLRGRGYGLALYRTAIDWLASEDVEPIQLVTQGANIQSQRLFQRLGGRIASMGLWYHRWLTP
jgi:dTDP-4-amino-4,6-dideoxy-D-galactose acyltransferase